MQYQSTANNAAVPSFPIFPPKQDFPVRALEFVKKIILMIFAEDQ